MATCPEPDEPSDRGFVCEHEAAADELRDVVRNLLGVIKRRLVDDERPLDAFDALAIMLAQETVR